MAAPTYDNNTVYFISGANRGIGFALATQLASNPQNIVIATSRHPSSSTALANLYKSHSNVHVLALDVSSEVSVHTLDQQLSARGITKIDYLISNAGIASPAVFDSVLNVPVQLYAEHYKINVLGPLLLVKRLYPYLSKSKKKVIYFVSSYLGSIGGFLESSSSAYANSKAALNQLSKQLSFELGKEGFIVVAAHPGSVYTDMSRALEQCENPDPGFIERMKSKAISPDRSAEMQIGVIEKLSCEDNGKFLSYTGDVLPW